MALSMPILADVSFYKFIFHCPWVKFKRPPLNLGSLYLLILCFLWKKKKNLYTYLTQEKKINQLRVPDISQYHLLPWKIKKWKGIQRSANKAANAQRNPQGGSVTVIVAELKRRRKGRKEDGRSQEKTTYDQSPNAQEVCHGADFYPSAELQHSSLSHGGEPQPWLYLHSPLPSLKQKAHKTFQSSCSYFWFHLL